MSLAEFGVNDLELRTGTGQSIILENVSLAEADNVRFHMLGTDGSNEITGSISGAGFDCITTGDGEDPVAFGAGFDLNIVYDFDIATDTIKLIGMSASSLVFKEYKSSDRVL